MPIVYHHIIIIVSLLCVYLDIYYIYLWPLKGCY